MQIYTPGILFISLLLQWNSAMYPDYVDSVKQIIQKRLGDVQEVDALNDLAGDYYYSETDSTQLLAQRALELSDSLGYKKGMAYALHHLAVIAGKTSHYDSALRYYGESLKLKRELKDTGAIAATLNNIGSVYYHIGNYSRSLDYFQESLTLKIALKDSIRIARTLNNIGTIHAEQKNHNKARGYHLQSLGIRRAIGDLQGQCSSLNNIGQLYLKEDNFTMALDYLKQAFALKDSIKERCEGYFIASNLGEVYLENDQPEEAIKYFTIAYEQGTVCDIPRSVVVALSGIGRVHQKKGLSNLAKKELKEGYELAKKHDLKEETQKLANHLYVLYKEQGKVSEALKYHEIAEELEDELFNKELTQQVTRMELNYAFQQERDSLEYQKQSELMMMNSKLDEQRRTQYFTVLGLILVMGIGLVIYRSYKINQRAKVTLEEKNKVISATLNEREVLLREIHHRVKNNLQVVSSLLNIQSKYLHDELAKKAVEEGRNRVQSMALVHEKLYQSEDLANIDVREYLEQLAATLFQSYNVTEERVKLTSEIDPVNLPIDTTIQLGLIINELVSNALKHAFPNERTGLIKLSLYRNAEKYELEVSDDGVGMKSSEELSKSYGYRIVKSIARGLDGTFSINLDHGTSFRLTF